MMGSVNALVIDGGTVRRDSVPLVLPRGYVLVKTLWARWGSVEEAMRRGLLAIDRGIAGYTGVGVVVETGIDADTLLAGKTVSLVEVSEDYMPPVKGLGFLAEYTAAPSDQLAPVPRNPYSVLVLDGSLACETKSIVENYLPRSVLVIGAGVYGIMTAYLLHDNGVEYSVLTLRGTGAEQGLLRELGLSTTQVARGADALVSATLDTFLVETSLKKTRASLLIMHPIAAYRGVHVTPLGQRISVVGVKGRRELSGCAVKLAKKLWKTFSNHIPSMSGLIAPPEKGLPALGIVYELSS